MADVKIHCAASNAISPKPAMMNSDRLLQPLACNILSTSTRLHDRQQIEHCFRRSRNAGFHSYLGKYVGGNPQSGIVTAIFIGRHAGRSALGHSRATLDQDTDTTTKQI